MELTSRFLYPLLVSVTCANALPRPYLVDNSDRFTAWLGRRLPQPLVSQLLLFQKRRSHLQLEKSSQAVRKALRKAPRNRVPA